MTSAPARLALIRHRTMHGSSQGPIALAISTLGILTAAIDLSIVLIALSTSFEGSASIPVRQARASPV
jgi:hypothetical protein